MTRFDLHGKTAIVTGGGWGIGRQLALGLAEHGANLVIADIDDVRGAGVVREIAELGGSAISVFTDVCDPTAVDRLLDETIARFGSAGILVNNTGGLRGRRPTFELTLEDWHKTLDLTVTSAFICSQRFGKWMSENGGGAIVNIASIYGMVGYSPDMYDPLPEGGQPESIAYAAGKGAMIAMTKTLASYWGKYGIRVNAISPGPTRTEKLDASIGGDIWQRFSDRTLLKRPGTPDDLVGAAIYLASPASDFMTGQVLAVDGGWTAW